MEIKIIDDTEKHRVCNMTLGSFEKTEYSYNQNNDKLFLVSNGNGIVTINTVDFNISKKSSFFVESTKEYLIANTSEEELNLIQIEIF